MHNKFFVTFIVILVCSTITQVLGQLEAVKNCYFCKDNSCYLEKPENMTTISCDIHDKCISIFDKYLNTLERGCYSHLSDAWHEKCNKSNDNECHVCNQEYCNNIGPTKCIQCNGTNRGSDCFYHPERIIPTFCPLSAKGDIAVRCFARRETNDSQDWGRIVRGCIIDDKFYRSCRDDLNYCVTCSAILYMARLGCNNQHLPAYFNAIRWKVHRNIGLIINGANSQTISFIWIVIISIGFVFKTQL